LKQLQLIQILRIKVCDAAPTANQGAKARRVNRVLQATDMAKAVSVGADTAC
jgi:hypothetical protein